jgi:hypothetical protein
LQILVAAIADTCFFKLKLTCDFHELKANEAARLQSGASEQGSLHLMEGDHTSYLVDMNLIPVFHCPDFR